MYLFLVYEYVVYPWECISNSALMHVQLYDEGKGSSNFFIQQAKEKKNLCPSPAIDYVLPVYLSLFSTICGQTSLSIFRTWNWDSLSLSKLLNV